MRMKRKTYVLLLVVVMLVTMVFPAIAAPSPTSQTKEAHDAVAISTAGVTTAPVSETALKEYKELVTANTNGFKATYDIPNTAKVAAVLDISFSGNVGSGVTIPIKVTTAKSGDYVIVMHRKASGIWDVVGRGFIGADLTIHATFTSFSPVMVLAVDAADAANSGIRAPKTGE
ncbi:MAG: hypothetical protein LBI54_02365 [Lachnospiraceae bacterium]|jgi:hypothetical protein|nr:hypothetical protein [Lachnospiraceae bacterium]